MANVIIPERSESIVNWLIIYAGLCWYWNTYALPSEASLSSIDAVVLNGVDAGLCHMLYRAKRVMLVLIPKTMAYALPSEASHTSYR